MGGKRRRGGLGDWRGWRGLVWSAEVGGLPSARSHLADGRLGVRALFTWFESLYILATTVYSRHNSEHLRGI